MASNSFGKIFKITTWGESHGKAIGVVIDGCPAKLPLCEQDINEELSKRQGGKTPYTTPRKEKDLCEILSGVFDGQTTGAPISLIIKNHNYDSSKYQSLKDLYRPGHANFTYLKKYDVFDYRGGGRSSARETACRVAAGAVAKKILYRHKINLCAYVKEIHGISTEDWQNMPIKTLQKKTHQSPIYCPDEKISLKIMQQLNHIKEEGDSVGGIIELIVKPIPIGLGDPIYEKLEASLAQAMMSIPASKGVEFGDGFASVNKLGSEHNDLFILSKKQKISFKSNHAGGLLGGISNGMPLVVKVAFKPASSIKKTQKTLTLQGNKALFCLPEGSRHDPCVAIRAVPVVEAMGALCLVDALLLNKTVRL